MSLFISKYSKAASAETIIDTMAEIQKYLFPATVFASAALVFMVEPMFARLVLPLLGGSPAVWNTSMAFFQFALLIGYIYAHLLQRLPSLKAQIWVHIGILAAAGLCLPLHASTALGEPTDSGPAVWLMGVLALSIGAPFAALSATAPLVQAWSARVSRRENGREAYSLYAASNLGSLLALIAYPVAVEPALPLHAQTGAWTLGYWTFTLVISGLGASVWMTSRSSAGSSRPSASLCAPVAWRERLIWLALSAMPASLLLGVTSYIATDVASAPFLWVVPLALYLITFVVAFRAKSPVIAPKLLMFQAAAALVCFVTLELSVNSLLLVLLIHLAGFFLTALLCHSALAARRPDPGRLTEFYLFMSLGGVLGGFFNAFLAPVLFQSVAEYPIVLALASLARPWGRGPLSRRGAALLVIGFAGAAAIFIFSASLSANSPIKLLLIAPLVTAFLLRERAWAFMAMSLAVVLGAHQLANRSTILAVDRDFFGVMKLNRVDVPGLGEVRELVHGTTVHGAQSESAAFQCEPLVYYARPTPIGQVFTALQRQSASLRIGAVGMGVGTVAAYTRAPDAMRFFEIDPLDVKLATDPGKFTYIKGCARGSVDWVVGDARLALRKEPQGEFDLLLVDAFSSDSVPAHLLTVEAMKLYLSRVRPNGVVVMHLSNRNLELMNPVMSAAAAAGGVALQQFYRPQDADLVKDPAEDVVIVARSAAGLKPFVKDGRWRSGRSDVPAWTDDYTNLFGAMVRRMSSR